MFEHPIKPIKQVSLISHNGISLTYCIQYQAELKDEQLMIWSLGNAFNFEATWTTCTWIGHVHVSVVFSKPEGLVFRVSLALGKLTQDAIAIK